MRDDIPGEGDTEFQRELYRTKLAHQHEIALLRTRNKHELRALRVRHAHEAEIVRAVGSELRDTLSLYSGGLLQLCTFLGPDHSAELIASITHRTACMVERAIETYVTGASGKADVAYEDEERDEGDEGDEGGDEWGGDGRCMNCDNPDCEGCSYDPRDQKAPFPSDDRESPARDAEGESPARDAPSTPTPTASQSAQAFTTRDEIRAPR
jgi:hypothetical protein